MERVGGRCALLSANFNFDRFVTRRFLTAHFKEESNVRGYVGRLHLALYFTSESIPTATIKRKIIVHSHGGPPGGKIIYRNNPYPLIPQS